MGAASADLHLSLQAPSLHPNPDSNNRKNSQDVEVQNAHRVYNDSGDLCSGTCCQFDSSATDGKVNVLLKSVSAPDDASGSNPVCTTPKFPKSSENPMAETTPRSAESWRASAVSGCKVISSRLLPEKSNEIDGDVMPRPKFGEK